MKRINKDVVFNLTHLYGSLRYMEGSPKFPDIESNIISTIWKCIGPQMHNNIRIKQILGSQQQRRHRD